MSVENVLKMIKDNNIEWVGLQFGDLFGTLQTFTVPAAMVDEELFEEGAAFDGSSIRAWKSIDKSDMLIVPDPATAYIDPFRERPTLNVIGTMLEPRTGQPYDRCPRSIAKKRSTSSRLQGLGDTVYFRPRA